jgi:hypothetical protein
MKDILKTPYNREELIDFIIDNSGEEFETLADVWEVAKETDSELAGRVERIISYQETEESKYFIWVENLMNQQKYELLDLLDYKDHYQNLLSSEENERNFIKWLDN